MDVNKSALLILKEQNSNRLMRAEEIRPDVFVFPLLWVLRGRFNGARIFRSSLEFSEIEKVKIIGMAGPRSLGAPFAAYVFLFLFGWITLSIPVLVQFHVTKATQMTWAEVKESIKDAISRSSLDPEKIKRLYRKVENASQLTDILSAVAGARE